MLYDAILDNDLSHIEDVFEDTPTSAGVLRQAIVDHSSKIDEETIVFVLDGLSLGSWLELNSQNVHRSLEFFSFLLHKNLNFFPVLQDMIEAVPKEEGKKPVKAQWLLDRFCEIAIERA